MDGRVARDVEMFGVPSACKHGRGVTANQYRLSRLKEMMVIKSEGVWSLGYCAAVARNLPVVLASILELKFKCPNRMRREPDVTGP